MGRYKLVQKITIDLTLGEMILLGPKMTLKRLVEELDYNHIKIEDVKDETSENLLPSNK